MRKAQRMAFTQVKAGGRYHCGFHGKSTPWTQCGRQRKRGLETHKKRKTQQVLWFQSWDPGSNFTRGSWRGQQWPHQEGPCTHQAVEDGQCSASFTQTLADFYGREWNNLVHVFQRVFWRNVGRWTRRGMKVKASAVACRKWSRCEHV